MLIKKYLRSKVLRGTTEGVREFIRPKIRLRQSKVTERDMPCGIQEYVLGFQITMSRK